MRHSLKKYEDWIRWKVLKLQYFSWMASSLFKDQSWPEHPHNILCISHNYIGDLIAITPALKALKNRYPKAKITLWVLPGMEEVLNPNNNLDEIITEYDEQHYDMLIVFHAGRIWDARKVYKQVKNIPMKIGVANAGMFSSWFPGLNHRVMYHVAQHIVEDNLDVVRLIGADINDKSYELQYIPKPIEKEVYSCNKYNTKKGIMILHPGSKKIAELDTPSHWWPIENWAALANHYSKKYNLVMTGTKSEEFIFKQINSVTDVPIINTMGKLDIQQTKRLIDDVDIVISMDSGPVHIAAALGTPVVSLMGPQDPGIWRPWTDRGSYLCKTDTHCKRLECQECHDIHMPAITVKDVIKEVERWI